MNVIKQGVALGLIASGLAMAPLVGPSAGAAAPSSGGDSLVSRIKDEAAGSVAVSSSAATGKLAFVRGKGDLLPDVAADSATSAAAKTDAYLDQFAPAFGARAAELHRDRVTRTDLGWTVTYTQRYQGLDVFGSMLRAQVDEQGDLTAVNGYAAPDLDLATTPARSAASVERAAVGTVRALPPGDATKADTSGLKAAHTDLVVYRRGSTKGESGEAVLTYVVEVTNGANIRDMLFFDADNGKLINRYSMVDNALERHLVEANGSKNPATFTEVWKEGDPFPGTLNQDQQNEVNWTGDAYWFFKDVFGRDSYDGNGHSMTTVNNDGRINCPNANWNGSTTNYCNGVTADDVVAHEWGHAYTEYTHGLIYQWQAGALNESYSDIWGETIDLINGKMDEGEGDITTKRPDNQCSSHSPALPVVKINSPASIAKVCFAGAAQFGPQLTQTGITSNVVVGTDVAEAGGGTTTDGCSALTNAAAVAGKIALVDRGLCGFTVKVKNAQNAGAIGVVIGNTLGRPAFGMAGDDPTITVPSVGISNADRDRIVSGLASSAVNVTMKDNSTTAKTDSYRWLMGEKSTAFGGAIRDMWMPTCYGDPGKVSDAEYYCSTDDAGGVHTNSGVSNHAYALLVDGGNFNGQTMTGIGLDKAAAIYFRAMTAYQTPTTNFSDHADALVAACADLVGKPINKLTVTPNAAPTPASPVTAADCTQVATVNTAVEFKKKPVQCNFQPLFQQGAPASCGDGFAEQVLWSDDFENGLAGWKTDSEVVYQGGIHTPWTTVTNAPLGHPSRVAFGDADGRKGQCSNGANDYSSRDSIISPIVQMPGGNLAGERLSFEHSIATELGVDGGNVKVSINGGKYTVVPAAAYAFNGPSQLLPATAGNTNPMAGEEAFTGSDGGELKTAWGTSIIDLSALGVSAGDTLRFRFDIGRDGCGGITGWWVDNVKLSICKLKSKIAAVHVPEPSKYNKPSSAQVTVTRDGSVGPAPTGEVTVKDAAGKVWGTAALAGGTATVALPAGLPVGVNTLTAVYSGDDDLAGSSTAFTATVVKGKKVVKAKVQPKRPQFAQPFRLKAKVRGVDGSVAKGKVVFRIDGKKVGKVTLNALGKASVKITKDWARGKHKLVVKYKGSSSYLKSTSVKRFRIH